jgi:hypothetical protein
MITDNFKGPLAFSNPSDYFCSRFGLCMLPMRECHFTLSLSLERSCYRLRIQYPFDSRCAHLIYMLCCVGRGKDVGAPACFHVLAHIACRLCIPCIEVSSNPPTLVQTVRGGTLEGMTATAVYVLNDRNWPEEGIDGCCPIFGKSI